MEYEEIQNNEVEALKAIYAADFKALENHSVWNKRPIPKFVIRLRPSTEYEDSSIEVFLQTTMTQTYPKSLPQIEIVKSKSLSGRQLEILKQLIDQTIKSLKGSEMIFEVTSNVQSQIDEWARFVAEAAPNLEEDRLRRLKLEENKQMEHEDKLLKDREAAAHQAEQKYDSLVLEELKRSRASTKALDSDNADLNAMIVVPKSTLGVTTFDRPIYIPQNFGGQPVVFRQIMTSLTIPSRFFGTSYLAKVLLPSNESKQQRHADVAVLATEIGLSSEYWRTAGGARLLNELNTELNMIRELNIPGIVPLSEFTIERFKDQHNEWVITLINPYAHLITVDDLLNSIETVNFKAAQTWAFQILECLELLHKAGLRHNMLCPNTLLISVDADTGERTILLRHPQYFHTLVHLNEVHPFEEGHFSYDWLEEIKQWIPPEGRRAQSQNTSPSSKWDIWQFGAVLTQMMAGKREMYNLRGDPESFVRSMVRIWPSEVTSFLLSVLNSEPSRRPSALELLTDQFFRTDLDMYSGEPGLIKSTSDYSSCSGDRSSAPSDRLSLLTDAGATSKTDVTATGKGATVAGFTAANHFSAAGGPAAPTRRRLSNNEEAMMSRYKQDFDEGIVLGRGGFGEVVKARNKLDGRVYAVKKVKATSQTLSHILQEVVLLSRLNHRYVVRYYTVWLEDELDSTDEELGSSFGEGTSSSRHPVVHDSLSRGLASTSLLEQGADTDLLESLPSSSISLSQFSAHASLSELDLPSVSQDFMSDSGFVEFGFSDSDDFSHSQSLAGRSNMTTKEVSNEHKSENSADSLVLPAVNRLQADGQRDENIIARLARLTSKTLYIQMEYCENHTLADLIRQGLYKNSQEYWRLLREILEALAYIHSEGVIHRDLKPKNIFIDQARNIKIGDFGLARSVVKQLQARQNTSIEGSTSTLTPNTSTLDKRAINVDNEDLTTDVGTSLYAAIEITRSDRRGYNEKVDIFSLGIIFLEMVWGFDTEMERIQSIKNARKPQIELPEKLSSSKEMVTQVDLIRSMLNHDPDKRPSASAMLRSGKIPVEDREMTVHEAISNVRDLRVAQKLTNELFSRPQFSAEEVLYDRVNATSDMNGRPHQNQKLRIGKASGFLSMSYVLDTMRTIFQTHGAIDNTAARPRIFPKSKLYKSPTVVEVMDRQGTVLQLPHDLTLPHARRLAEIVPDFSKTYAIDSVYRTRLQNPSHHPARHIEVDFDIIASNASEESILDNDAEAMAVMYDAAHSVLYPECNPKEEVGDLVVIVSHQDIISASLSQCGLIPSQYYAAMSILSAGSLTNRHAALARSNISTASLDILSTFGFCEEIDLAESRMSRLMALSDRVRRGLNHVKTAAGLFAKICTTQSSPKIQFSPLINTATAEFYVGGIIFQLVHMKAISPTRSSQFGVGSVLAVGGRYDSLIKSFRNSVLDGRTPLAKAVGFGMSADKLEGIISKSQQHQPIGSTSTTNNAIPVPPRCQVLVSSLSEESVKIHGMEVVKLLWTYGIHADIVREPMSTEGIVALAQWENVPIVIIIKQGHSLHSSNKTLKPLRAKRVSAGGTQSQNDLDLTINELIPFVKNELGLSLTSNSELDGMMPSADSNASPDLDISGDRVIVINEAGKLKGGRKNKWQLEERSCEARAQFLTGLANAPLVSLDLRDDVLEAITTVTPHSAEDWKRRVVGLSPNQKAYIMAVQAKLSTEAMRSPQMLLYSSKTENVFVYNY